jgi:hypothetical protein
MTFSMLIVYKLYLATLTNMFSHLCLRRKSPLPWGLPTVADSTACSSWSTTSFGALKTARTWRQDLAPGIKNDGFLGI